MRLSKSTIGLFRYHFLRYSGTHLPDERDLQILKKVISEPKLSDFLGKSLKFESCFSFLSGKRAKNSAAARLHDLVQTTLLVFLLKILQTLNLKSTVDWKKT